MSIKPTCCHLVDIELNELLFIEANFCHEIEKTKIN